MASTAVITFRGEDVGLPIYVVTSLSTPPWKPLEMHIESQTNDPGPLCFTRKFDNIAPGSYQYKIRIGDNSWVVDESQETACDESGNRNNVIHVMPLPNFTPSEPTKPTNDGITNKESHPILIYHVEPGTEEERAAPLFRHESFDVNRKDEPLGTIAESDEGPAEEHKVSVSSSDAKLEATVDGTSLQKVEYEELAAGLPLHSQATGLSEQNHSSDMAEVTPLFSHEIPSSGVAGNEDAETNDSFSELARAPTFSHETFIEEEDEILGGPLLPHEQPDNGPSGTSSDGLFDDELDATDGDSLFPYDAPRAFLRHGSKSHFFMQRTRTGSTLPNALPRFDDDDPNLCDPNLEPFPVSRDRILERMATIGEHLPVDESITMQGALHSPLHAIRSRGNSSEEISSQTPQTPQTPLVPVVEENEEEEDEAVEAGESDSFSLLLSSLLKSTIETSPSATPAAMTKGYTMDGTQENGIPSLLDPYLSENEDHNQASFESDDDAFDGAAGISQTDGTNEVQDTVPNTDPYTPPLTPERDGKGRNDGPWKRQQKSRQEDAHSSNRTIDGSVEPRLKHFELLVRILLIASLSIAACYYLYS